jgi:hypothetical protein
MIADIIAEDRNEEPIHFIEVIAGIAPQTEFVRFLKHLSSVRPP